MAKKKPINKISDKLTTINDNFTITMYDNGYLIDVSGRNADEEYSTAKIMVSDVERLIELVREAVDMDQED